MDEISNVKVLPVLILRSKVMFPNIYTFFDVSRLKSLQAVVTCANDNSDIFVVTQKNSFLDDPTIDDIYKVGVICHIKKAVKMGDNKLRLHVEGYQRAIVDNFTDNGTYIKATLFPADDLSCAPIEESAYLSVAKAKMNDYTKSAKKLPPELGDALLGIDNPAEFINVASFNLPITEKEKQSILEERVITKRLELLSICINGLIDRLDLEKLINDKVQKSIEQSQKEYYLREQLKAIHNELGDDENEIESLRSQIIAKQMPKQDEEKVLKELNRMSRMQPSSPDYTVIRTYLDWILDLPFNTFTKDTESIIDAEKMLDEDHFGLSKVKERIIEYIAVMKLTGKVSGNILCLAGPPGVGKTSVATSVARALNRNFVRMSLGGVKDEAEVRGHRKTYIGAMPGRIIYGLKDAKSSNPVFLLDEIDKLSSDLRGDPASALLEVLDTNQNTTFRDRYLEIPFDLSNVLFITTANSLDTIPSPLLDRMEVISLDGYTREEKMEIAKRYLIPKRLKANGLTAKNVEFTDDGVDLIIKGYTKEAGVRNLEREIDKVIRKIATKYAEQGKLRKQKVTVKLVQTYLGSPKYLDDEVLDKDEVGVVNGLAWTMAGGTTLNIEVCLMAGKGDVKLTGKLGDVMKESALTALSYIKTNAKKYNIDEKLFTENDIHIHVPEGATPKDGPSAGVTMATAILSCLTNKRVRKDVAMTGEITLRGKVLPIGGLKEKSLAAFRCGVYNIYIPYENKKDIEDIPENIVEKLHFIPVKNVDEIFDRVFTK